MYQRLLAVVLSFCSFALAGMRGQHPHLDVVALPTRIEGWVGHAPAGSVAVLVLGLQARRTALPGGLVLGTTPDVFGGLALVGADGSAELAIPLQRGRVAGLRCFAQAVAWQATSPPVATPLQALSVPAPGEPADVYVLFGQSNAEGYASTEGLPLELRRPMPRCRVWNLATGTFEALAAGRNGRTLTTVEWFGPELTLSRSLSASGRTTYLVKLAVGQTALGRTPGPMNEWGADADELYALLQSVLAAACNDLRAQNLEPRVRGVLMVQGESDATTATWANGYEAGLRRLVQRQRADLAAAALDGGAVVPFVIGLVAADLPAPVFPFVATVRAAQLAVAAEQPACAVVETSGLSVQANETHFDDAGLMSLGLLLSAELQRLTSRP